MAKRILNIITTVLLVTVIAFIALLAGPRLFGLTPYCVLSGSMRPTYGVGSLIYIEKVDTEELEIGDPVTYITNDGTVVTHRIIDIIKDDATGAVSFKTKGDANNTADFDPVRSTNVLGKPVFSIPLIGYVVFYMRVPPWNYVTYTLAIALILLMLLPDLIIKLKKSNEGDAEQ